MHVPFANRAVFDREIMPGAHVFGSECCRAEHFLLPLFAHWCRQIGLRPTFHRKLWEYVYILQVLHERGCLHAGTRGLGFAAGEEPLPAYFASLGMQITASDLDPCERIAKGWAAADDTVLNGHSREREDTAPEDCEEHLQFRRVDMNAIPDGLTGFDFCWSACALEHLGSIEAGQRFLFESLKTLRPGGLSVHTTEYNVKSDADTLDNRGTVIFRKRDIKDVAVRLREAGHIVAPLNFYCGSHELDHYVDVPPYREDPHLKLLLLDFTATSFGIVIQKKPDSAGDC